MWNTEVRIIKNCKRFVGSYSKIANENCKPWNEIPGPKSLPLIKQIYHFLPGIGKFRGMEIFELNEHLYKNYGPIVRIDGFLGMKPFLLLYDPEAIAFVYRSENSMPIRKGIDTLEYFRKKYNRVEEEKRLTGLGTEHGPRWKTLRSTMNPVLLQPKTIKLYDTVIEDVAKDMVQRMKSIRNESNMITNFNDEITKWALESVGTVALGGRIGCLDKSPPEEALEFTKLVSEIIKIFEKLEMKPPIWKLYSTKNFRKAMKLYQKHANLAKYFINRARKDFISNGRNDSEKGVLEKLLEIDERIAVIIASDMLLGGVDTTAAAVMSALYLLSSNVEKQDKLRKEIMSSKDKTRYLKACLRETHRMMPVGPANTRESSFDYEIQGYKIPKGVNIIFNHQYISMLEEQFPKPKEFIPERWLVDKDDPLYHGNSHSFTTLPFGFGTRMCIGRRIAQLEMEIFLTKILDNFRLEWKGPPPKIVNNFVNYMQEPYNFVFRDL